MPTKLKSLSICLQNVLGDAIVQTVERLDELTLIVKPQAYAAAMHTLRDHPDCRFEQLIDLCGMDYSGYGEGAWEGARFAVVYPSAVGGAQSALAGARVLSRRRLAGAGFGGRHLAGGQLVSSARPSTCSASCSRASRPAPHPDRLWLHRPSVPQGFPAVRQRRDALRPDPAARDLPAGHDRAARNHAAHRARRKLRGSGARMARDPQLHDEIWLRPPCGLNVRCAHVSLRRNSL